MLQRIINALAPKPLYHYASKHFWNYRDRVSRMYDVDISDVTLGDRNAFQLDFMEGVDSEDEFNNLLLANQLHHENLALYWCITRRVYVFDWPEPDEKQATRAIVHELAHAVHDTVHPFPARPDDIFRIVQEGFAEYAALFSFPGKRFVKENKERLKLCNQLRDLLEQQWDELENLDHYNMGLYFYTSVVGNGITELDIIRNPPTTKEEILNPKEYARELRQKL